MHSTCIWEPGSWNEQPSWVDHLCLRSLYLTVAHGETDRFERLLDKLALPAAVRIEVVLKQSPAVQIPHTLFVRFLSQCKTLKELVVQGFKVTYEQLFEYPLVVPSITRLEGTVEQEIVMPNFETAMNQTFAQCAQLTEVQILGFDDDILVEYYATRTESNGISLTVTHITPGCIF